MESRLKVLCQKNKLIGKEQIGFEENSRAPDHILTLKSIVNKYVTDQKGKKLYCCFIDFRKAFDSVWHAGLFRKLENLGINGNFLDLIKSIYKNTKCAVKFNNKTTNFMDYKRGVLQGNPLSPLLFNLYINDIIERLKPTRDITLNGIDKFNVLMYADDIIVFANSKEILQQNLDIISKYCEDWKLQINSKKTKCMTFTRGNQKEKSSFKINGQPIENN